MNIFISQIFIFVCNSIISVIYYKVYNELPGVGADAKTLISVIYYNMYNVTKWAQRAHQNGRKRCTGNTPHLAPSRHQERKQKNGLQLAARERLKHSI